MLWFCGFVVVEEATGREGGREGGQSESRRRRGGVEEEGQRREVYIREQDWKMGGDVMNHMDHES